MFLLLHHNYYIMIISVIVLVNVGTLYCYGYYHHHNDYWQCCYSHCHCNHYCYYYLTDFKYPDTVIHCAVVIGITITLAVLPNCKLERQWGTLPLPHSLSVSMAVLVAVGSFNYDRHELSFILLVTTVFVALWFFFCDSHELSLVLVVTLQCSNDVLNNVNSEDHCMLIKHAYAISPAPKQ